MTEWQMIPGYRGRKTWQRFTPDVAANGAPTTRKIAGVYRSGGGYNWHASAVTADGDSVRLGSGVVKSPVAARNAADAFLARWQGVA